MKKKSLSQKILSKNYVIFIISLVISIAIWTYMSLNASNDTTVTITNIPIQMELSESTRDLGLQIFTGEEQPVAAVTVTGNRTILGSMTASDITVTASANSVTSSGFFTLPVSAVKKNPTGNFQITNSTPSSVGVMVDYFKESEFPIQDEISFSVQEGYYGAVSMPYTKVTISGPQSELMKISRVAANANVQGELTESADVEADIVLYDDQGNEISTKLLTMNVRSMTVNIVVLKEKTVKVEAGYTNKPSGLDLTDLVEIYPSSILLAGPDETLKTIVSVKTEAIDFSTLSNEKKTFSALAISIPEKCKNISNNATAKVTLDLSGLSKKSYDVDNFTVKGLPDDFTAEVTSKSISVTVIGTEEELNSLTADKITGQIDVTGANLKTGSVDMPVTFKFSGVTGCWTYGTYRANLNISDGK